MSMAGLMRRRRATAWRDELEDTQDIAYDDDAPEEDESALAALWQGAATSALEPGRARVAAQAVLGVVVSVVGVCAALTGLLAPEAFVLGAVGALLSFLGLAHAGRPGATGRGTAALGALLGLTAAALAAMAMSGRYSWIDAGTDHVAGLHRWLADQWSWLGRWS
ncbi:MAG TPA: hypothetical protein VGJ53_11135 [Micromonosporaceae bacterium]